MKKKRRNEAEEQPPVVEDSASEAKSFGPWLRRQREGRDIELRDIAQASKISLRYLDALENNRFEALPAELFTKGFLRQYSSFVGLDAEEVVNYYLAAKSAADDEKAEDVPEELRLDRRGGSSGLPYLLAALLVAGLIVAGFWWFTTQRQPAADTGGSATPATSTATSPASASAPAAETPPPADTVPSADEDGDGAAGDGADGSPEDATDASSATSTDAAAEAPPAVTRIAAGPADGPIELVLDFNADCWVEASIDGQNRIAEMRVQGESMRLTGRELLEVMVGNIDAVKLELNGSPWEPPGTSKPVRRLQISLETTRALGGGATAPTTPGEVP